MTDTPSAPLSEAELDAITERYRIGTAHWHDGDYFRHLVNDDAAMPRLLSMARDALALRQAAEQYAKLAVLVESVVQKYNAADDIDLNNDPAFDGAVMALYFWREDNYALAAGRATAGTT